MWVRSLRGQIPGTERPHDSPVGLTSLALSPWLWCTFDDRKEPRIARLAYLAQDQLPAHERQLFNEIEARFGRLNNIFRVLAHHPVLLRHVIDCGVALRHETRLDPVLRELAILTVGRLTRCDYELTHHGALALRIGMQAEWIDICLDERAPLLVFFWGDPQPYVEEAHRRGIKVFLQVGSVTEAQAAAEVGVDAIIVQGLEAGGHVRSTTALSTLLPAVVEAVSPVPVIAAGGIADSRGLVAALSLGAQAVSLGTRFLCSEEALAEPSYKERVVRSTAEDTVYTTLFNIGWEAPHRVLRNTIVAAWEAAGCPPPGQRSGEGTIIGTAPPGDKQVALTRYTPSSYPPLGFRGDIEDTVLYAGEACGLIHDIKPAAQIVRDLMRQAEEVMARLSRA